MAEVTRGWERGQSGISGRGGFSEVPGRPLTLVSGRGSLPPKSSGDCDLAGARPQDYLGVCFQPQNLS